MWKKWFSYDFLWVLTYAQHCQDLSECFMGGPGQLSLASKILVIKEPHINAII